MHAGKIQRVIIIERNESDALHLQSVVQNYCPTAIVHCCVGARDALHYLRRLPAIPVDLILVNIEDYNLGGYHFLKAAEKRAIACTWVPVVILTVNADDDEESCKPRPNGLIADFLHKPIVPEFFQYLMEFHFERDGVNSVKSPSASL